MSLDIHIKLSRPVETDRFFSFFNRSFEELFGLKETKTPDPSIKEVQNGNLIPFSTEHLDSPGFWIVSLYEECFIELMIIRIGEQILNIDPSATIDPEDMKLEAEISVRSSGKDDLRWALGIVCAIAIARESDSTIIDEGLHWSPIYEQHPNDFLREVKTRWPKRLDDAKKAWIAR